MTTEGPIDDEIKARARDWHTRMNGGEVDEATARAFEGWLHADPAHKKAYHTLEQMWRDLDYVALEAGVDVQAALRPEVERQHWSWVPEWARLPEWTRRPALISAGVAAATVAMIFVFTPIMRSGPTDFAVVPDHETRTAEIRAIRLPDGSVVTLGAKSQIDTAFTAESRQVTLLAGEAFFDVAKDPMRPFYVAVDDTLIRVVGTKFDVKRAGGDVHVSVLEGIVDVIKTDEIPERLSITAPPSRDAKRLTAGQRIIASAEPVLPEIQTVETVTPGGWREGRLAYEDASLREIVADVNRYSDRPIRISESRTGDLRFTLAFRSSEIDVWLEVLEDTQPVEVVETPQGELILRAKRSSER